MIVGDLGEWPDWSAFVAIESMYFWREIDVAESLF